jgi:3',5'-cyclic AMP phosphodiesterase CpdA
MTVPAVLPLRIAVTADLHWGTRHAAGREATLALVEHLRENPPDLLILAGDIGAGDEFAACLDLFDALPGRKAAVPGNHDVWVLPDDARGDSLAVYADHLPKVCARYGFHYLDAGPLILPGSDLAVVGSMNWYDYSWARADLPKLAADWEDRLERKRFSRGVHNDAHYVRWTHDDASFTRLAVGTLARHVREASAAVGNLIAVTHHPPFRGLNYPQPDPPTLDSLLWLAFSGNAGVEDLLAGADRVRFAFCGHTHFAREADLGHVRGYNVGGDYHFKRLLWLDWPAGTVEAVEFVV